MSRPGSPAGVLAVAAAAAAFVLAPAAAAAQAPERHGRFELSAGGLWVGGSRLGSSEAVLTPNVGGSPFVLFRTSSEMEPAPGVDVRLAFHLSRLLAVEGGLSYASPNIVTRVTADAEGAAPVAASERLLHYTFDASLVAHLTGAAMGRAVPFVLGGAGHLRHLHEGAVLVETGPVYHVGGGVKLRLLSRPDGFLKGLGIRAEGRANMRDGGADFQDDIRRRYGSATLGLLFAF